MLMTLLNHSGTVFSSAAAGLRKANNLVICKVGEEQRTESVISRFYISHISLLLEKVQPANTG